MTQLTQEQIDAQIKVAIASSEEIDFKEPRAKEVFYDKNEKRIVIYFANGAIFSIPTSAVEWLSKLSNDVLAEVALTPSGKGLRWDTPDLDLSIQGLLIGIWGTKQWMAELGRKDGSAKTKRKVETARENG
jgi:Protein of unknown function (DUF2442)